MGWKNIKEHYRIEHIVRVEEGAVYIGSGYVSHLIRISPLGEVTWGAMGPSSNADLARYHAEMTANPDLLLNLLNKPDDFHVSLPVYTYQGGCIIEKRCEEYGWPNATHDGCVQYDNAYDCDKARVVQWAKDNAQLSIRNGEEHVLEAEERLEKCRVRLGAAKADLSKLETDYPSL